jgi:hypothetical protein
MVHETIIETLGQKRNFLTIFHDTQYSFFEVACSSLSKSKR